MTTLRVGIIPSSGLAPLYLGRVAALVRRTRAQPASAVVDAMEQLGRVFEAEKSYLTDRWR